MPEPDVQRMARVQVYDGDDRLISSMQMSEVLFYTMSADDLREWLVREGPSYLPAPGETVVFVLRTLADEGAPVRVGAHGAGAAEPVIFCPCGQTHETINEAASHTRPGDSIIIGWE